MNFKVVYLVAMMVIFHSSVAFCSSEKWENGRIDSLLRERVYLEIYENEDSEKLVGLYLNGFNSCSEIADVDKDVSAYINGTKVEMGSQCMGKGMVRFLPYTIKGMAYLIKELKTKKQVVFRIPNSDTDFVFSTRDFTKSYDSHEAIDYGL